MRLYLDDTPLVVDLDILAVALERQIPNFLMSGDGLDAKERALRLTLKAAMRTILATLDREIVRGALPLPRPVIERRADPLAYGVNYLLTLLLLGLDSQDWQAAYVESEDGGLTLTGVAARTGARAGRETPDPGAASGDAGGAPGVPARPLAYPGDDELRQDDVYAAVGV